jgi:predicted glycogen debranching enzyme
VTQMVSFGRQVCGALDQGSSREWLVTDGLGGFAMGTVAGLRTRRYHGLLVSAANPPISRHLGLAALDPVLVIGDRRIELATHQWASGVVSPRGFEHLATFGVDHGVPRWQWSVGPVVLSAEVAMAYGENVVGITYRLLAGGSAPVRLEVGALCTWRDVHGERWAGESPAMVQTGDGFIFENAYRVHGPGFEPDGQWYLGVHHREEAARGLNPNEDLWCAGRFAATLQAGDALNIEAWTGDLQAAPSSAATIVVRAHQRFAEVTATAGARTSTEATLANAADQFIVAGATGPTVVAGYPWFGDWSRDTMISYEGLFLETGRIAHGRDLLLAAAKTGSEGMLANTADAGGIEYNTVDGTLWFLHAIGRHIERNADPKFCRSMKPVVQSIIDCHVAGTRFGIGVDTDGLIREGADGLALTWMDARVDGAPVTRRAGKPVEVNALWIRGLQVAAQLGLQVAELSALASASFAARFVRADGSLFDVVDGPDGDDATVRPNQLVASALGLVPAGPVLDAVAPLITSLGLRSLSPTDGRYVGRHRGGPAERDHAYHQGTVWPWLIGPLVDSMIRAGRPTAGLLDGLIEHLSEWGLGSVSETADGDLPHGATGCPFQAWSVAELFRSVRALSAAALAAGGL